MSEPENTVERIAKALFEHQVKEAQAEFDALRLELPDAKEFFLEVRKESDAALAILTTSYIDTHLTDAWTKNMRVRSSGSLEYIFDNDGALSSFSRKIRLARALGWISEQLAADLHLLRRIRNRFAHDPYKRAFDDPEISGLVQSLHPGEEVVLETLESEQGKATLSLRTLFHIRAALICFHMGMQMVAAPIAERHRVPLKAVIGSYDDGADAKREHFKSIAFITITLVRSA